MGGGRSIDRQELKNVYFSKIQLSNNKGAPAPWFLRLQVLLHHIYMHEQVQE